MRTLPVALSFTLIAVVLLHTAPAERADVLIADFEGDDYGDWKTTGTAFGKGPARGTLPGQMPVTGFLGKGLVNSFAGGDGSTGTLTSPPIVVERRFLNFLIGGGMHPGETCINLLIDGKIVRTATGPNDRPGGSEQLDWHAWDVAELAGKKAAIEIVDRHTGGWGHINIDHIVQSDRKRGASLASREFAIEGRYLHLPIKNGAPKRRMRFVVDDKIVREFDVELADGKPDFVAFGDVAAFKGRKLRVETMLPGDSKGLAALAQSNELPDAKGLYQETNRPQFHFSAPRGWLNDPNGLVFLDGEYHLFYQHNPYGWDWGNMHWGHAVSTDLVRWRNEPIALYPRQYGDWCFSGSAVADVRNTSGFQAGKPTVLVAAFTSTGRGECIAFSNDRGRTWTEHAGNPVVRHNGRDPKLVWHEPTQRWVMAVYDEGAGQAIAFHSSPDLKKWTFESKIAGFYECPDLFELPVAGETAARRWVLSAADGRYLVGAFDGRAFRAESGKQQVWYGNFYAAQTYDHAPDSRRIQIGWNNGARFPGMPFNQQMTIPCQLTLRKTAEGIHLFAEPVREVETLRVKDHSWTDLALEPGVNPAAAVRAELLDIAATFRPAGAEQVGFVVRGVPVVYDVKKQEIRCRDHVAPLKPEDGAIQLRVLADRGSLEVFGNAGRVVLSAAVVLPAANQSVEVFARGATVRVPALRIDELRSAWTPDK